MAKKIVQTVADQGTTSSIESPAAAPTEKVTAVSAAILGNVITLKFGTGKSVSVDASKLTDEMRSAAMMHGLKQKFIDAAAIPRDTATGRSATFEEKQDAVLAVVENVQKGSWNLAKGEGATAGGLLLRALIQFYPTRERAELQTFVAALTPKQQNAMRENPKIKAIIDAIKDAEAKDAAKDIDTDALLAQFESADAE